MWRPGSSVKREVLDMSSEKAASLSMPMSNRIVYLQTNR